MPLEIKPEDIEKAAQRETEKGVAPEGLAKVADERDNYLKKQGLKLERLELELDAERNNIDARKKYALRTFILVCSWLGIVLFIVCMNGFNLLKITDAVLITLISTTTANILAYFTIVLWYLFPSPKSKKED